MTKEQKRWKLNMELKKFLAYGGVIKKIKTGAAVDYHPYDTDLNNAAVATIDSKFQIKKTL